MSVKWPESAGKTIPITVPAVAVPFHLMGLSFNVMSLGGIAIAAGGLVDEAIVVVEHKKLEEWQAEGGQSDLDSVILNAVQEVGHRHSSRA